MSEETIELQKRLYQRQAELAYVQQEQYAAEWRVAVQVDQENQQKIIDLLEQMLVLQRHLMEKG